MNSLVTAGLATLALTLCADSAHASIQRLATPRPLACVGKLEYSSRKSGPGYYLNTTGFNELTDNNGTVGTDNITVNATDNLSHSAAPQTISVTVNSSSGAPPPAAAWGYTNLVLNETWANTSHIDLGNTQIQDITGISTTICPT